MRFLFVMVYVPFCIVNLHAQDVGHNFVKLLYARNIKGYPPCIPVTVNNQFILTHIETIESATEIELGIDNSDSVRHWLALHASKREFVFKKNRALNKFFALDKPPVFNRLMTSKIDKLLKDSSNQLIAGIRRTAELKDELQHHERTYFYERLALSKKIFAEHPDMGKQERNFIMFLVPELVCDDLPLYAIGKDITGFQGSASIYELWKKELKPFRNKYDNYAKQEKAMENKYLNPYLTKYGNSFIAVLFSYGYAYFVNERFNDRKFLGSLDAILSRNEEE